MQRLYLLLTDKRFEFVFDREDANKVKVTPADTLIDIKDWADSDDLVSTLTVNQAGAQVSAGFALKAFAQFPRSRVLAIAVDQPCCRANCR